MSRVPLVLLPGLLCDRALWSSQVTGLSDIAVAHVADMTQDDSIINMAKRVLAEAPPRFALAGLSMGGYCALEVMRQAPERVFSLALLDTHARADTPAQTARRKALMAMTVRGEFLGVTPRLLPLFIHPDRLQDKELVEKIISMVRRVGKEAFLRQQKALIEREDLRPTLPLIQCPTLILCGSHDQLSPPALHEEMAKLIPHSSLQVLEHCGHLSTMEQPELVNQALRSMLKSLIAS